MRIPRLLLAMTMMVSMSACATAARGFQDDVVFISEPPGAYVTARAATGNAEDFSCVAPCELALNRKRSYEVSFQLEGYEAKTGLLEPKISANGTAGMTGSVIMWGVVGAAVDASSGAMNDLKPNPLQVRLTPVSASITGEHELIGAPS